MFEDKLKEWMEKVINAYNSKENGMTDTFAMIEDVDKIIAEAFEHDPVFN